MNENAVPSAPYSATIGAVRFMKSPTVAFVTPTTAIVCSCSHRVSTLGHKTEYAHRHNSNTRRRLYISEHHESGVSMVFGNSYNKKKKNLKKNASHGTMVAASTYNISECDGITHGGTNVLQCK